MSSDGIRRLLREARPSAGDPLRSRVFGIVNSPARPATRLGGARERLRGRRLLLVLVPTAAAAVAIGGLAMQMFDTRPPSAAQVMEDAAKQPAVTDNSARSGATSRTATPAPLTMESTAGPGPVSERAARTRIEIELEIPTGTSLSDASREAVQATAELSGRVVSRTGTSGSVARLTLSFPAGRLQQAIARLTRHGTILSHDIHADDDQAAVAASATRIRQLRLRRAQLEARLRDATLDRTARAVLERRMANVERRLVQARGARSALQAATRVATVGLTLSTRD